MSKCLIIPGNLNKKLVLPFILSIAQIILVIVNKYYEKKEKNDFVLQFYSFGLAELFVRALPLILKISDKNSSKIQNLTKGKKCCHYTLLCVFFILSLGSRAIAVTIDYEMRNILVSNIAESFIFPINDFILMSIEFLFMVGISLLLLKYKFYIHHIISIVFVIIFGILTDGIVNNSYKIDGLFWVTLFIRIFGVATDALYYSFKKYMMEVLYYPYWNIALIPGIYMIISATVLLLLMLSSEDENSSPLVEIFIHFLEMLVH